MRIRLSEKYPNDFLTLNNGMIFKKDTWTDIPKVDEELEYYLEQSNMLEVDDNVFKTSVDTKKTEKTTITTKDVEKINKKIIEQDDKE